MRAYTAIGLVPPTQPIPVPRWTSTRLELVPMPAGGSGQTLMLFGGWYQYDSLSLRCRHGFRETKRCPRCHSHLTHPEVRAA